MRLLGLHDKIAPHVQEGLDTAKAAHKASEAGRAAARSYWAIRPDDDDLVRVTDELASLEKHRQERRR